MRIARFVHPATLLLCICSVLCAAACAYEAWVLSVAGMLLSSTPTLAAVNLLAVGALPWGLQPVRMRAAATASMSLLAVPLARHCMGSVMHDLAIAFPWLQHDRWCAPDADRLLTTTTAPYFVFLPIFAWACALWIFHARHGVRHT